MSWWKRSQNDKRVEIWVVREVADTAGVRLLRRAKRGAFSTKQDTAHSERAIFFEWVSSATYLKKGIKGRITKSPLLQRIEVSEAYNWTRWRIRPGASLRARKLFRDGPKHAMCHVNVNASLTDRFARAILHRASQLFCHNPCSLRSLTCG